MLDGDHAPTIGISTGLVNGHLTDNEKDAPRSNYRGMLAEILNRIHARLERVDLSASAASRAAGLSEDAIRNMERAVTAGNDRKGVSTQTLMALAPVLRTTAGWLLDGTGEEELVRVIGTVGADPNGDVVLASDESFDYAPLPPGGTSKAVALEVKGFSMPGVAEQGSLIYFEDQRAPPTDDMIGHVVVVETAKGQVLIKRLGRGSKKGLYDLESINGPKLPNVKLAWAAEITAIVPPRQARRILIRGSEMAQA